MSEQAVLIIVAIAAAVVVLPVLAMVLSAASYLGKVIAIRVLFSRHYKEGDDAKDREEGQ